MSKENDLEGAQDMGGNHGGQKGMPQSPPDPRKDKADARMGGLRPVERRHDSDDGERLRGVSHGSCALVQGSRRETVATGIA